MYSDIIPVGAWSNKIRDKLIFKYHLKELFTFNV